MERCEGKIENFDEIRHQCHCVYVDPPWRYSDGGCGGGVDNQYRTMSLSELYNLQIWKLVKGDAHLWMWTTWPMIRECAPQKLINRWGFRWVGEILWVKPGLGVGRWLRPSTEILVLGVRGQLKLLRRNQKGHFEAKRGKHSEKPEEAYRLIESLTPGPYVELFARKHRPGWFRWGLEA